MWARLRDRLNPPPPPPPPKRVMSEEEELLHKIFSEPAAPERVAAPPGAPPAWVDATPVPVERRPYLELSQEELERNATLDPEPQGRSPAQDAKNTAFELVDKVVYDPFVALFQNLGVIAGGAAVLAALAFLTWLLAEWARGTFGTLVD